MTSKQLKIQLSVIEPDVSMYSGIGPAEIPLLKGLLKDKEAWVACRAVFALSKIADPNALAALTQAAADPRQEVRVAVAASTQNLTPSVASKLLLKLLADRELGVRKFALLSVSPVHNAAVRQKVKEIKDKDPVPAIRSVAKTLKL